jgi:RNA polymerase sigma-70 factor (ECF subfamily)
MKVLARAWGRTARLPTDEARPGLHGAGAAAVAASPGMPADDGWRLWRAAVEGEAASARALVAQLTPTARGLAMRLLGRGEDADDAVQDAFERLWRADPRDDRGARIETYFNTIVINRCRTVLVARREWATDPDELAQAADAASPQPDGPAARDARDRDARLHAALRTLPPRQRMAVVMWAWADQGVPEIARTLELDDNAAHQLLYRARRALRRHLEDDPS